ncbi:hypothetical protein V9T40_001601 [Parthenolecanium corni]|uniref:Tudor domain-containing protein n=1 Tax=Parthenolecanium corni TaxID=536013 RepID=A0AAN9Y4R3_9HEMI
MCNLCSNQIPKAQFRDITSQPLPCCFCCNHQTLETCTKCSEPFCSKLCMIRGYEGHTNQCILVPCRAKIVELEPLTIYYIDFGNEEKVDIEDLYPLPKKFQTTPPMVMCF